MAKTRPAVRNILVTGGVSIDPRTEFVETLASGRDVRLERIISRGHSSLPGFWYDQSDDEWVALLKGKASIAFEGGHMVHLSEGDSLLLPAGMRHRLAFTSSDPDCVWLALHMKAGLKDDGC